MDFHAALPVSVSANHPSQQKSIFNFADRNSLSTHYPRESNFNNEYTRAHTATETIDRGKTFLFLQTMSAL
jgi:hypothetical protein